MKKFLMMAAVALLTTMTAGAQRLEVMDAEGHGIPMVSVLTEDGTLLGTTDLSGVLPDVKGNAKVARKKAIKADYGSSMTLNQLAEYERQHHIPALSAATLQAIGKLKSQW